MTSPDRDEPEHDDLLPRLFRVLGPRPSIPADTRRRWETTFGAELARQVAAERRRRVQVIGGCVGAALLLTLGVYLFRTPSIAPPVAIAEATRVTMVVGQVDSEDAQATRSLKIGGELNPGDIIRTGPGELLALRYRETDVRLNSNTVVILEPARLQLVGGDVYVDSGVTPRHGSPVIIETPFGTLTHLGTQFTVSLADDELTAAVREGAVAFSAGTDNRTISAADGPSELVVTPSGIVTQPVSGTGGIWGWTVDAAPGYVVDGRSADAFLIWATRQTGAHLSYADDATRFHSETVIMHGDTEPLTVTQGLDVLNATTGLSVDTSDPAFLRVSMRPPHF